MSNMDELVAALDQREITDGEGTTEEQTFDSDSTTEEQETPVEETAEVESPVEEEVKAPQVDTETETNDIAEDDTGRKYVPEKRFSKVYGEKKELERQLRAYQSLQSAMPAPTTKSKLAKAPDKMEALEMEMLYEKYPEFDQYSDKYSPVLDELGYKELVANPNITKLEAARRAIATARNLTATLNTERNKVTSVKREQAEGVITSSSTARIRANEVNPENMSVEELETYLRKTGQW